MYKNNNINSEVSLASQTHHVPHIGLPHKAPVVKAINEKMAPVGAIDWANMNESLDFKARPTMFQKAITRYRNIDIQAAGTWMKIIL